MILSFLQTEITYASSGMTDINGCHDSKKESWHCHNNSKNNFLAEAAAILIVAGVVYGVGKAIDAFSSDKSESSNTVDTSKSKTVVENNNHTQNSNEVIQINSPTNKKTVNNNLENVEDTMRGLFGVYIGELANTSDLNKIGDIYEIKSPNNLLGFDKYNIAFKYEKIISISSNKVISSRGCTKEKDNLKEIMEDNFGNKYKITISNTAYLLTYSSFISMISCQDNKLSFVLKGK